jgi:hypothetical protein
VPKSKPAAPDAEGDGGWVEKRFIKRRMRNESGIESQILTQKDEEIFGSPPRLGVTLLEYHIGFWPNLDEWVCETILEKS